MTIFHRVCTHQRRQQQHTQKRTKTTANNNTNNSGRSSRTGSGNSNKNTNVSTCSVRACLSLSQHIRGWLLAARAYAVRKSAYIFQSVAACHTSDKKDSLNHTHTVIQYDRHPREWCIVIGLSLSRRLCVALLYRSCLCAVILERRQRRVRFI